MKKKIFFVSDIHGYYEELIKALNDEGFDENNPSHLLVVLGDIFDRGESAVNVYLYLKRLADENKAIVCNGNHHDFLTSFLKGSSYSPFNYMNNGLDKTIADFWHRTMPFESWCIFDEDCEPNQLKYAQWVDVCRKDINEEYPELLPWLEFLPEYFESKNYIGVHAAIDTKVEDWHKPHCYRYHLIDWEALHFNDGSFFGDSIINTDKKVVIGHFGTRFLREMYGYPIEHGHEDDILIRKDGKVIAIDATTPISHKINVFVVEDELLNE